MNRQTPKRISTEAQVHRPRIQEKRSVVSRQGAARERHGSGVRGRGRVSTVCLSTSMSGERSGRVIENDENRASVEGEGITSTEMHNLETMTSESQPVLTKESLVGELPTLIPTVVRHAFAHGSEELGDVFIGEHSQNDEYERLKEGQDPLL